MENDLWKKRPWFLLEFQRTVSYVNALFNVPKYILKCTYLH